MKLSAHTNISDSFHGITAFRLISEELSLVKKLMDEQLTVHITESSEHKKALKDIDQLLESLRSRYGKMLRPGLVLLAGKCFGPITNEHIQVAASIEMIHNATLLHDDVIDDGKRRRGQPSINSIWGNESAVLLGDFLLSKVFKICAELETNVANIIATAAVRLCEGELRQIAQKRNWQLTESEYIDVITEKSAVLFSSCCHLGALLSGADKSQIRMLSDYGLNAGIAFQITDDLLDIIGDEKRTGKTLGSDVNKCKLTLAVIHLLGTVDKVKRDELINTYLESGNSRPDTKAFAKILEQTGSLEYARNQAQEYVTKAIDSLNGLDESSPLRSEAKNALIETAKFMANRAV